MKWSTLGLAAVGVAAALLAAVLWMTLRASAGRPANGQTTETPVEILVAAKDLPAMAMVEASCVEKKSVSRKEAAQCFTSEPLLMGRVLSCDMKRGQAFSRGTLVMEGSNALLAATLGEGKRAVSVALSDSSGMHGLLYPGCLVDVLASFKLSESRSDAVAKVLMEKIPVLAIGANTVFSPDEHRDRSGSGALPARGRLVTLMVDVRQAAQIALAHENGSIVLAMRNPRDGSRLTAGAFRLSELRSVEHQPVPELVMQPVAPTGFEEGPSGKWVTIVIRGGKLQEQSLPLPERVAP